MLTLGTFSAIFENNVFSKESKYPLINPLSFYTNGSQFSFETDSAYGYVCSVEEVPFCVYFLSVYQACT